MRKVRVPQNSFQFGEVSDSLLMRTDAGVYAQSAQSLENMLVMAEGAVKKRWGLKHVYEYDLYYNKPSNNDLISDSNGIKTGSTDTGDLTLNGVLASGGIVTFDHARHIRIVNFGNNAASTFTITGTDRNDNALVEVIAGTLDSAVISVNAFHTITNINLDTVLTVYAIGVDDSEVYNNLYGAQSHLARFIFDDNEQYVVSIEHKKVRVFRVVDADTVTLVSTITADVDAAALPFSHEYLRQYTMAQYGDVMFICHPLFAPRLLIRTSLTTFEIDTFAFDQRNDGLKTYQPYSRFRPQGMTLDPSATTGTGISLTTSDDYWTSDHVGSIVRYGESEITITGYTSATVVTGDVVDELQIRLSVLNALRVVSGSAVVEVTQLNHGYSGGESITVVDAAATGGINAGNLNGARTVLAVIDENTYSFTAGGSASSSEDGGGYVKIGTHAPTTNWDEQSFSSVRGYPAAVTFHEGRLVFGGTIAEPDKLWMSKIGDYFNFDVGIANDDESIQLTAATGDVNEIRYLVSNRDLQVFTVSGELYVPTYLNQAITPTNAQIRKQTPYGCSFVTPDSIDGATIFVQHNGHAVREYIYSDSEDAYTASSVSTVASHLMLDPKCLAIAHSAFDLGDSYAAITLDGGDMALFSSNRAEKRASWTKVTTSGSFCSVVAIEDRLFANVWDENYGLQLCEFSDTYGDIGLDLVDTVAVASQTPTVTGGPFENGNEIYAYGIESDGTANYLGALTIDGSGQVDVGSSWADYDNLYFGKKFTAQIVSNPIDGNLSNGPTTGDVRSITNIVVDVRSTESLTVNGRPAISSSFTGKKEVRLLGHTRDPQVTIAQDDPLPMQVNGFVSELIV